MSTGNQELDYMIEPGNPTIEELSRNIVAGKIGVVAKARAIYDYMRENYEYIAGEGSTPQSCTQILASKIGDCDEQTFLFCALCRAAGIPAWPEFGLLYDSETGEWGAHAWVLLYVPLADGSGGTVNVDVVNNQFLARDCYRITDWESDGVGERIDDYDHILNYTYPMRPGHNSAAPVVSYDATFEGTISTSNKDVKVYP